MKPMPAHQQDASVHSGIYEGGLCPAEVGSLGHVSIGTEPGVLADIRQKSINLAVWRGCHDRVLSDGIAAAGLDGITRLDVAGAPDEIGAGLAVALKPSGLPGPLVTALVDDAVALAARFAAIMGANRVDLRLERITGDGCKRFHADQMTARLITTYRGPGTEWLSSVDATRIVEGRVPEDATIHRLEDGAVAMMKGRLWSAQAPLFHRSPRLFGTKHVRLVLVIDVARPG